MSNEETLKEKDNFPKEIIWNDSWALECTFTGRDFLHVKTSGSECGSLCEHQRNCTHFVWMDNTCWLKYGPVSKSNAIPTGDPFTTCGISRAGLGLIDENNHSKQNIILGKIS